LLGAMVLIWSLPWVPALAGVDWLRSGAIVRTAASGLNRSSSRHRVGAWRAGVSGFFLQPYALPRGTDQAPGRPESAVCRVHRSEKRDF